MGTDLDLGNLTELQQGVIKHPPPHLTLEVNVPETIETKDELARYLRSEYSIDICLDENSPNYENLYYNSDERSMMGFLKEWGAGGALLFILSAYFILGWEDNWVKLIRNSEIRF
jgi:hypothetical protein